MSRASRRYAFSSADSCPCFTPVARSVCRIAEAIVSDSRSAATTSVARRGGRNVWLSLVLAAYGGTRGAVPSLQQEAGQRRSRVAAVGHHRAHDADAAVR